MNSNYKKPFLLAVCTASSLVSIAQVAAKTSEPVIPDTHTDIFMLSLAMVMVVTIVGALITLTSIVFKMLDMMRTDIQKANGTYVEPAAKEDFLTSFFNSFGKKMTDAVPITEEASIDMGHDYDGIRELDNNLPPWWVAMFVASIIFGVGYFYYYHMGGDGKSVQQQYAEEMEDARLQKLERLRLQADKVDEESVKALTDAADIESGKNTFISTCKTCHGEKGEGLVGPNLTDQYWLHGGGIKNIFKTIKYGVPAKGMISWESQLTPRKMQEVASYILTLQGTNPPNAKAPQGTIDVPEKDSSKTAVVDTTASPTPAK